MGVYSELLDSISTSAEGKMRLIRRSLKQFRSAQGDIPFESAFAAKDAQHQIPVYIDTVSGGTFDLAFVLWSGETFICTEIAYDADAATIEAAVDSAATAANITGWTNGDISVSGGPLTVAALTFDYSGDSVKELNHFQIGTDGTNLTGGGSIDISIKIEPGQSQRPALAALESLNVISGDPPEQGALAPLNVVGTRGDMYLNPSAEILVYLATQAGIEDSTTGIRDVILDGLRENGVAV
jgi:hypothetical protein